MVGRRGLALEYRAILITVLEYRNIFKDVLLFSQMDKNYIILKSISPT